MYFLKEWKKKRKISAIGNYDRYIIKRPNVDRKSKNFVVEPRETSLKINRCQCTHKAATRVYVCRCNSVVLPCAQLTKTGGMINEEHGPAISSEGKVHVMNGQLKVAQITILGQGQEFSARSNWHTG